jgi:hypothetical protein
MSCFLQIRITPHKTVPDPLCRRQTSCIHVLPLQNIRFLEKVYVPINAEAKCVHVFTFCFNTIIQIKPISTKSANEIMISRLQLRTRRTNLPSNPHTIKTMFYLLTHLPTVAGIKSPSPASPGPIIIPGLTTHNAYGYECCQCSTISVRDPCSKENCGHEKASCYYCKMVHDWDVAHIGREV